MENTIPATVEDEKLHKRAIRAWTMYDWANSTFATTIMAAVLPVYYSSVAASNLPAEIASCIVSSSTVRFAM